VVLAGQAANVQPDEFTLVRKDKEDLTVLLVEATKVLPDGATLADGDRVRVVAQKPAGDTAELEALVVQIVREESKPPDQPRPRPRQVCGVIKTLPDTPPVGTWTVAVPAVGDFAFTVNDETEIRPEDKAPGVGDRACVDAQQQDDGSWLAIRIALQPRASLGRGEQRVIVLHGTEVGAPGTELPWTLTVALKEGSQKQVQVTADTKVTGQLADGARLMVQAVWRTDASGTKGLVATHIVVPAIEQGQRPAPRSVRIKGVIETFGDTSWTITLEDGSSLSVAVDAHTTIVGTPEVTRSVEGRALRQADGTLLAKVLRVECD
jgi:hypothetical protein